MMQRAVAILTLNGRIDLRGLSNVHLVGNGNTLEDVTGCLIEGNANKVSGSNNVVVGDVNVVSGRQNWCSGASIAVSGDSATVLCYGEGSRISGTYHAIDCNGGHIVGNGHIIRGRADSVGGSGCVFDGICAVDMLADDNLFTSNDSWIVDVHAAERKFERRITNLRSLIASSPTPPPAILSPDHSASPRLHAVAAAVATTITTITTSSTTTTTNSKRKAPAATPRKPRKKPPPKLPLEWKQDAITLKDGEAGGCSVCLTCRADACLLPCAHLALCMPCARKLAAPKSAQCPICREPIAYVQGIRLAS